MTVCWRIVDLNNNSVVNRSCDQPLSGGWFLTPEISLSQGQYIVQVNVTNDVSAVSGQSRVLSVYNGGGKWPARIIVISGGESTVQHSYSKHAQNKMIEAKSFLLSLRIAL